MDDVFEMKLCEVETQLALDEELWKTHLAAGDALVKKCFDELRAGLRVSNSTLYS